MYLLLSMIKIAPQKRIMDYLIDETSQGYTYMNMWTNVRFVVCVLRKLWNWIVIFFIPNLLYFPSHYHQIQSHAKSLSKFTATFWSILSKKTNRNTKCASWECAWRMCLTTLLLLTKKIKRLRCFELDLTAVTQPESFVLVCMIHS